MIGECSAMPFVLSLIPRVCSDRSSRIVQPIDNSFARLFFNRRMRFNFSQRETRVVTRELREKLKEKKKKTREVKPVIAIPDIYLFPSPIRLPFEAYGRCENVDDAIISVVYDDNDDEDEKG